MMTGIVVGLMVVCLVGLVGVFALFVSDMASGIERQRQQRLALEDRLRKKGIIK
jgi:hypothetical protein